MLIVGGPTSSALNFLKAGVWASISDVAQDGVSKKDSVLGHNCDCLSETGLLQLPDINAIQLYATALQWHHSISGILRFFTDG